MKFKKMPKCYNSRSISKIRFIRRYSSKMHNSKKEEFSSLITKFIFREINLYSSNNINFNSNSNFNNNNNN